MFIAPGPAAFAKAVHCLAKIGDELYIESQASGVG